MLEALIGGKLVIAGDSPSHRELPGFVSIGQGLRASLADAIVNKPATVTKIISAQDFVVRTYSPFRIAMLWNEAFTSGSPEQQRPKIRLNLGCGDKILTTYINVDLISGRKGRRPDLASDVSDLRSIGDGTVDEILAVHIFEHFYLWEVPKLLSEWARVLRSGGKIVIECPNLAAACAEFHSPHSPGTGDQNFDANTMWVFYGDPSWKDPLMCHRWGYTPSSLASLLSAHGFVHVRQEPAEFKKREPRDMRLVAEKC
jgi:SAM-dependent methyltransferase